ncbi:helix-turn-helix domain-containing protein [Lacticaseibacillus paracasei]|uniref:helix-turn-helix domain-containing protein n=1 Tax=Lacticaseibacillus paracasei TaxID=1597 RepID=UPI001CDA6917|nr:helix-turn-helix transcriptional regulator [Lacticaseibacillus paracasei]
MVEETFSDKKLVARIINLREKNDWTQKDLADRLGMNKVTMNKIENMNRSVTLNELTKMARLFDVSTDYLLGKSDKPHYYSLTEKDYKDVEAILNDAMNGVTGKTGVNYFKNGGELTDDDRALLEASMKQTIILAKELAKKKFTPRSIVVAKSDLGVTSIGIFRKRSTGCCRSYV